MKNKLSFESRDINDSNLYGVNFSWTMNSETNFTPGDVNAAELVFKTDIQLNVGDEFDYYNSPSGETNYNPWQHFIITDITKEKNLYKCTAYDPIIKTDIDCSDVWDSLGDTFTLRQLVDAICDKCGLIHSEGDSTVNESYTMSKSTVQVTGITCRELLKYACQVAGGFGFCVDTVFGIINFGDMSATTITKTDYKNFKISDYTVKPITKVWVGVSEDDVGITSGTGTNILKILDNPLLYINDNQEAVQTAIDNIYNLVSAYPAYYTWSSNFFSNWYSVLTPLNPYAFYNINGKILPVFSTSWDNSGYYVEATGNEYRPEVANGELSTTEKRLNGKYHKLTNTVDTLESEIYDPATGTSRITQLAGSIETEVTRATTAEDGISETASTAYTQSSTAITQSATAVTTANNASTTASTAITQSAEAVTIAASKYGEGDGNAMAAEISLNANEASISASKINFTGVTTFLKPGDNISQLNNNSGYQNSDGVTTIVGNTVTTSYIEAKHIDVESLTVDGKDLGSSTEKLNIIYTDDLAAGSASMGDLDIADTSNSVSMTPTTVTVNGSSSRSWADIVSGSSTPKFG